MTGLSADASAAGATISAGGAAARRPRHEVAELALAEQGQARIEWADAQMPVLRQIRERFARERPLAGLTLGACLHVTTETANLVRTLAAGGADVGLCASNPLSTQDDTAAALVDRYGVEVFAVRDEDVETYSRHLDRVCDKRPQLTMDDGADVIGVLHSTRRDQLGDVIGGTEETTTGVLRLRALEAGGGLCFPVVAVNEASTKHFFDNRYGTGQSTLDGILRATNVLLAGSRVVVVGYGWCGRGVAMRAAGAGAKVIVCEVDPLRALEAVMEGYEVMPGVDAARIGDVFVTVTGGRDAIGAEHFELMKDGAIVCNAGHFDVEIDKHALDRMTAARRKVRPLVDERVLADGRRINLLADGRLVNLAAAEGHPAAVMDMSFSAQALAAEHLARHGAALENRVHAVPDAIDDEIARLKLESLAVRIDALSEAQLAYRGSWEKGT